MLIWHLDQLISNSLDHFICLRRLLKFQIHFLSSNFLDNKVWNRSLLLFITIIHRFNLKESIIRHVHIWHSFNRIFLPDLLWGWIPFFLRRQGFHEHAFSTYFDFRVRDVRVYVLLNLRYLNSWVLTLCRYFSNFLRTCINRDMFIELIKSIDWRDLVLIDSSLWSYIRCVILIFLRLKLFLLVKISEWFLHLFFNVRVII